MSTPVINEPRPALYRGLTERLVSEQLVSSAGAAEIAEQARTQSKTLIQELLDGNHIDSAALAAIVSEEYGVPLFNLTPMVREHFPLDLVPQSLIRKHKALPLYRRGNRLFVAIADPTNTSALAEFKFATGIATDSVVVEQKLLLETISEVIAKQDEVFDGDIADFASAEDYIPDLDVEEESEETDFTKLADDAPVVKFVNKVLFDAIKQGASDIHFEPYEREYRVRVRSDGVLQEIVRPPKGLAPRLSARLKVMARLDISERRAPQDGRIQLKLSKNRSIDFRVSTLPTLFGEKIVLRILDPGSARMGVDALGYEADQKALYLEALAKPQGMILVTGPTGSGKTVSLYTGLDILNEPERNISTAEDPVESIWRGSTKFMSMPRSVSILRKCYARFSDRIRTCSWLVRSGI